MEGSDDVCRCLSTYGGCFDRALSGCSANIRKASVKNCDTINEAAVRLGCSYRCYGADAATVPAARLGA